MRYSKRKTLALATGLCVLSAALLTAHEPQANRKSSQAYQHIEQPDMYLVMSEQEQLKHAQQAVYKDLVRPLRPHVEVSKFSRAAPSYDPDYRPTFAKAQNGTVPFSLYKHTDTRKRLDEQQRELYLVGFYDVTTGRVMVFDSRERNFVAATNLGNDLKRLGLHEDPQKRGKTAIVKRLIRADKSTQ